MKPRVVLCSAVAALVFGTVGLTSGCATKRYVRTKVDESAHDLSAKIDARSNENERGIKANSNQIEELNSVTREHTQKIGSLDSGLQQTDAKARRAMAVGEGAQGTADKAVSEVSSLEQKFQNRNQYVVLSEEQVRFKFNSAKLDESSRKVLDGIAQRLKENRDAILLLEGHTDSIGPDTYNIQFGEKRLEAVTRYLVVDLGVPMHKVSQLSFGKDRPLSPNKTKEGRAQNRAVVMRIMGPNFSGTQQGMVSEAKPQP